MALLFLPADKIERRFYRLQQRATTDALRQFTRYVEDSWITSNTFPPATWSVYLQAVRTNNDLEGWHNALNRRAKGRSQLPLYILIQLLHKEASLVSLQIRLVSERRLRRHQRTTYRNMQKKLLRRRTEELETAAGGLLVFSADLVNVNQHKQRLL